MNVKLYHSSNIDVPLPEVRFSRNALDFGKGFYLTTMRDQAINYAQRFQRRKQNGWLNSYVLNLNPNEWKIRVFERYDKEWLDFISNCRAGMDKYDYDLVIGGIANDKVIRTLDRYFAGELSTNQALGFLIYEKPNIQYCIRSQEMLDKCLTHIESTQL